MSINLKKIMVTGAALLMFASVATPSANVSVSARHVRTHRVRRHSRRALRRYRHGKNVHKYNSHKLAHRRHLRHYRSRRNAHKRNVHKINARKYNHKRARHNKQNSLYRMGNDSQNWSVNPSDITSIKREAPQSPQLNLPKAYYGNYFDGVPGKKGIYSFLHLAKHGTYALANPFDNGDSNIAHPLGYTGQDPNKMDYYDNKMGGYDTEFLDATVTPLDVNRIHGKMIATEALGQKHTLIPVSERQGIHYFEKYNIHRYSPSETKSDY